MTWQTTYPSLATVMDAGLQTINTWREQLPEPTTDVQRTIQRRLQQRQMDLMRLQLKTDHPEISQKFEDLQSRLTSLGIKL